MKTYSTYFAIILISVFFLFLGIEYWYTRRKNVKFGLFENAISNIVTGLSERTFNLFLYSFFIQSFYFIYDHFRLFTIESTWYIWIIILPLTDFIWYWYHRLGHEVNILWAAHVVHHQSEDFNFTVAARITIIQAFIRNIFWCSLPLLGFHPNLVSITLVVHGAYSFFTHTETIKNYGDLFVFWDKLFGTFEKEDPEIRPIYGITEPIKSYSFLWQHFHYFFELHYQMKQVSGIRNKIKILFGKPENLPSGARETIELQLFQHRKKLPITKQLKRYLGFQVIASAVILAVLILRMESSFKTLEFCLLSILLLTFINCGALLEQKRWIIWIEYARAVCILLLFTKELSFIIGILLGYTLLVVILTRLKFHIAYWRWIYK